MEGGNTRIGVCHTAYNAAKGLFKSKPAVKYIAYAFNRSQFSVCLVFVSVNGNFVPLINKMLFNFLCRQVIANAKPGAVKVKSAFYAVSA